MQAILTKYLPATNTRGSRIKASCDRGSIVIPYPHEGTSSHEVAARALVAKFVAEDLKERGEPVAGNPWSRQFVSGGLPDGTVAHVFLP